MRKALITLLILLSIANVCASDIALIVKNSTELDYIHEYRINRILKNIGFNVILIDKSNADNVNYDNYAAIVIAGRPSNVNVYDHLDNFVASLPVNTHPTVVIDSAYPDDFGWIAPGAIGTLFSNQPIYITVTNTDSIFAGYNIGDSFRAHIINNQPVLNLDITRSALNSTACPGNINQRSVISVAEPGTVLLNGNVTTSRIVFFGITEPLYWTDEVEGLFENSVNWVLYNQLSGTKPPTLTGEYSLLQIDIYHDGTKQFLVDMGKNMVYDKFWDPNRGILTDLKMIAEDKYGIDVNNDGRYEYIYDNGFIRSLPDLTIDSFLVHSQPKAGEQLNITIQIKNVGKYMAKNFRIDILLDTNIIDSRSVAILDPNQSYTIDMKINNLPAGQHDLKVITDAANDVFETNEDNNIYNYVYIASTFQSIEEESNPLTYGSGSTTSSRKKIVIIQQGDIEFTMPEKIEIEQGQTVSITGKLRNPLEYPLYNISFLVRGDGFSTAWYKVTPEEIGRLDSNKSISLKIDINMPSDVPIYTYNLIVKALTSSKYGTRTYEKIVIVQVKERVVTTTTVPQEQKVEEKSLSTGLITFVKSNWIIGSIFVVLVSIFLIWNFYGEIMRIFKSGYKIGKGWKQPKKK